MAFSVLNTNQRRRARDVLNFLPPVDFITVHYAYFFIVCLVASGIFWGSSQPYASIAYIDALFLVVSAMTEAGLNTVNLSTMTTFQQFILFFLIIIGSSIWVSIFTVATRKRVFESRFRHVVKSQKEQSRRNRRSISENREAPVEERLARSQKEAEPLDNSDFESRHSMPRDPITWPSQDLVASEPLSIGNAGEEGGTVADGSLAKMKEDSRALSFPDGIPANPASTAYQLAGTAGMAKRSIRSEDTQRDDDADRRKYASYLTRYNTGRNAQFFDLTREEREHLGGVEYRAISLLAWIVPLYFVLWQVFACIGMGAYMAYNKPSVALENGINPWWLGAFNSISAFNNSGMSLLDANMIPFQRSIYPLFTMGLLILAGNTAYPLFLRLILWIMLKTICTVYPNENHYEDIKETLRFVLQYPRRVYTNLFPSSATWWLFFVVILLNSIDWAAFELLNIGNKVIQAIPVHDRTLDGLFQALAVRSGGFYVVAVPTLRIGLQVLYVIMMYISVYPVVITMRHSNVYEERSLGIYADDPILSASSANSIVKEKAASQQSQHNHKRNMSGFFKRTLSGVIKTSGPGGSSPSSTEFVRQQVRGQLSHDLWIIVLAILFISCIETSSFERDPAHYSVFNIIFEVVSAYGCVGISIGLPDQAYSYSGSWHKASKLILCVVMLRGRHRGLPVALDRAVRLPSENEEVEEMDGMWMSRPIERRMSMAA